MEHTLGSSTGQKAPNGVSGKVFLPFGKRPASSSHLFCQSCMGVCSYSWDVASQGTQLTLRRLLPSCSTVYRVSINRRVKPSRAGSSPPWLSARAGEVENGAQTWASENLKGSGWPPPEVVVATLPRGADMCSPLSPCLHPVCFPWAPRLQSQGVAAQSNPKASFPWPPWLDEEWCVETPASQSLP